MLNGAAVLPLDIEKEGLVHLASWMRAQEVTVFSAVATVFRHFARVDRPLLLLNILLLMLIAFVPFPTRVAAEFFRSGGDRRDAALLYGITMTITAVCFFAVWIYGSSRLLRPDTDMREVSGITRSYLPGAPMYATATLIAFASGLASLILFAVIALFYAISASFFGRDE